MKEAFYKSCGELARGTFKDLPPEFNSGNHLIYSSPATLAFNSPGAQGFGVKRAGLAVPGSVMLLVAPCCCGRNTTALNEGGYAERFFYLMLDDTDLVTGRHLNKIPQAVKEVCLAVEEPPSAVMICITCVDALLGTDMDRVCRKASEAAGVPVVPCYMYALTREGRLPPMVQVRQSIYSLLEKTDRKSNEANILGFFSPLQEECELYTLLQEAGVARIREISRCSSYTQYQEMARANFNLVLNSECRYAAQDLQKRLGIPFIELPRVYQIGKIRTLYRLLGQALSCTFDDEKYYLSAKEAIDAFGHKNALFSVGEWINADSFELALALLRYGFRVKEIFGTVGEGSFVTIKQIALLSPETRIYSNLSPSMLYYREEGEKPDFVLGKDARYYHKDVPGVDWNGEEQPFGYAGVKGLFESLKRASEQEENA